MNLKKAEAVNHAATSPFCRFFMRWIFAGIFIFSTPCESEPYASRKLPVNEPVQATSESYPVLHADISKHGKQIVFSSGREDSNDLWLRSLNPAEITSPKRLTHSYSPESFPAFSPDGKHIAFVGTDHDVKGDIYLLELSGSDKKPVRLTGRDTTDGGPCFSPDGNVLYFHQKTAGVQSFRIASYHLKDRRLTALNIGEGAFPAASPDGKKLAFVSARNHPSGDIFIADIAGEKPFPVTRSNLTDLSPVWSPDGGSILFTRFALDTDGDGAITARDNPSIYRVRLQTSADAVSEPLPVPLTSGLFPAFQPRLTDDSLYFLSDAGGITNCWRLPADGEISQAASVESQVKLAEEMTWQASDNPYLKRLAWYRAAESVLNAASADDNCPAASKIFYEIGRLYRQMQLPEPALQFFGLSRSIPVRSGTGCPWASFSEIQQVVIRIRSDLKALVAHTRIRDRIESGIAEIGAVRDDGIPAVRAAKLLETARLYQEGKNPDFYMKAVSLLDRIQSDYPDLQDESAEAAFLKADLFNLTGNADDMVRMYLSVIKLYPDSVPWADEAVSRILNIALQGMGDAPLNQRVQLLQKIAEENRGRKTEDGTEDGGHPMLAAGALNRIGDFYFASDEWASAKSFYRQVIGQFGGLPIRQTAAARLSLAEILYREERFREALDLYETEIGARSHEDRIYQLARKGYIRKSAAAGEYLYRLGEISAAKKRFREIIGYDDTVIEAHRGYIKCAAALQEIPAVIGIYNDRISRHPKDPTAIYGKALCLTYLDTEKDLKTSRDLLIQAVNINGSIEYFHQTLGYVLEVLETVHAEKGLLEHALESYRRALFLNDPLLNPENTANLVLNCGNIFFLLGQYGNAFEYYTGRLETGLPFDHPDTEILFYSRLGISGFRSGETRKTISAFQKAADLISERTDPKQASRSLDAVAKYNMNQIIAPVIQKAGALSSSELKHISAMQSDINRRLAEITPSALPPPSPEWDEYRKTAGLLLADQESVNQDIIRNLPKNSDIPREEIEQTHKTMMIKVRESLAFPERLLRLKSEITDRLGLAYQEANEWQKASDAFRQASDLNRQLGLYQNLAVNKRSAAYNAYLLSGTLSGEKRASLLQTAARDFSESIELVNMYGVPDRKSGDAGEGKGLIRITAQISFDDADTTQAAYGFSPVQEIRLAQAFISRIQLETGNIAEAEKAIQEQIAAYPPDKPVQEKDVYGVSLLFHRAGHIAAALNKYEDAFRCFHRSFVLSHQLGNPVSTLMNVGNMANVIIRHIRQTAVSDDQAFSRMAAELESADRQASLLVMNSPSVGADVSASYFNRMGVAYFDLASAFRPPSSARRMYYLQKSGERYFQGIRILPSDQSLTDRKTVCLLAAVHLNLAVLSSELQEPDQADAHFSSALDLSEKGHIHALKWRALAGLKRFDDGLQALGQITAADAGCGPREITRAFAPKVAELADAGQIEDAFNLAEWLSEQERFHRTAFFISELPESEHRMYRNVYPRIERIRDLKQRSATAQGNEKRYLEDSIGREYDLLKISAGPEFENLSDFVRLIPHPELRENVMALIGISVHLQETAEKQMTSRTSADSEEYRVLSDKYRQILKDSAALIRETGLPDMAAFFGPEPVEAVDIMDILPDNSVLTRIFELPDRNACIMFTVDKEDIRAEIIPSPKDMPVSDNRFRYVSYENPSEITGMTFPVTFNGTHLARSIRSRKPLKSKTGVLTDKKENLTGIHTLRISGETKSAAAPPVRNGEYPARGLWADALSGSKIPLHSLLFQTPGLSLALLHQCPQDDMYLTAQMFSIYGCPTVILSDHQPAAPDGRTEAQFAEDFLTAYQTHSAWEALKMASQHQGSVRRLLFGDVGMTPEESRAAAGVFFTDYVKKGREAFDQNKSGLAQSFFENAVLIAQESEDLSQYLPDLYRVARESAYKAGNLQQSLVHAEALTEVVSLRTPDSEAHAEALLRAGLIYAGLEQFDKAVRFLEEAVEMLENLDAGADHISAVADLGVVLENIADYDHALDRFRTAAELSEQQQKDELAARQYNHIGRICDLRLSRYARAIQYYRKALEIHQDTENHAAAAQSLLDIGRCYRLLGNFPEADRCYQQAYQLVCPSSDDCPPTSLPASELYVKILTEQANNAWFQARYEDAFRLQRQAYRMAADQDMPLMKIITLNTSGLIRWTLGDPHKALDELKKAFDAATAFKEREDEIASTLNNIGIVYREMNRYDEALKSFNEALAIDTKLKSRWGMAYDLRNIAQTHLMTGKTDTAIPLFQQSADESHAIGNRMNESKALLGLGDAYLKAGRFSEAEAAYRQALDAAGSMTVREVEWRALFGIANVVIRKNGLDAVNPPKTEISAAAAAQAEQALTESLNIIESVRAEIRIEQLRDHFIANKLSVYETLIQLYLCQEKPTAAFEIAERSRARNFIDLLGNQRLKLAASADRQLYDQYAAIRSRIDETDMLISQSELGEERNAYQQALGELHNDLNDLMLEIQASNPQLASVVSVQPLTADQVQSELEPDVCLLAYYITEQQILCWVIRNNGIQLRRTPVSRSALVPFIKEYRRRIQNLEPVDEYSKQLSDWLIAPVAEDIRDARILGIIPHNMLHYLSFAALFDGKDYLIDRFSLFYLPSASVMEYTLQRRTEEKNVRVLAIGNPDTGDPALDLPFSEYEVASVQWNFPDITVLTREKATESWIVKNIGDYGIIHLASHGEFNPINPLFSSIKLVKCGEEDGNLEAAEVFGLTINAKMIVLSACQTGLGKITEGDDVIGLSRAFLYAGTHTLISSLWRVSDISTAILIKQFYRNYVGQNTADSLRQAILHVKNIYPHPGYWGAFTVVGDFQ